DVLAFLVGELEPGNVLRLLHHLLRDGLLFLCNSPQHSGEQRGGQSGRTEVCHERATIDAHAHHAGSSQKCAAASGDGAATRPGCSSPARISVPFTKRGPLRLKYADPLTTNARRSAIARGAMS